MKKKQIQIIINQKIRQLIFWIRQTNKQTINRSIDRSIDCNKTFIQFCHLWFFIHLGGGKAIYFCIYINKTRKLFFFSQFIDWHFHSFIMNFENIIYIYDIQTNKQTKYIEREMMMIMMIAEKNLSLKFLFFFVLLVLLLTSNLPLPSSIY